MTQARAIVFANGEYSNTQARRVVATNADYLVCVDGGLRHCLEEDLTPDVLVGDLDSLDEQSANTAKRLEVQCIQYLPEKDTSDLELALLMLQERCEKPHSSEQSSFDEVIVLGASGGRSDHCFFNWQMFGSQIWPFDLRWVDDTVDARVIDSTRPFNMGLSLGQTFSVVPVGADATGVNVTGARYPLSNATLSPGSTLGLSNLVNENRLQVSVDNGIVLLMIVHQQ